MKCLTFLLLFFFFFFSSCFSQTTKLDLQKQISAPTVVEGSLLASFPGVGFITVKIDAATLEFVSGGTGMILRAKTVASQFKDDFFKVSTPTSLFRTSVAVSNGKANLSVYLNGLLQREVEDYDVAQEVGGIQAVTFKTAIGPGNSVTLKYTIN